MEAAKYFKERKRMLNSLGRKSGVCDGLMCSNCPFADTKNGKNLNCSTFEAEYPEETVAIVEEKNQKFAFRDDV